MSSPSRAAFSAWSPIVTWWYAPSPSIAIPPPIRSTRCAATIWVTCSSQDPLDRAVRLIPEHAVRRLPAVDGGRLVGALGPGDPAVERAPDSALADISAAEPRE
ncbi:hypothetical protein [Streptomyces sp. NPDC001292]|uniref:hypothetical protein n=1 Tax=Streptomyces sp. NPDC001292 TaxID=3364558 RepID=UPI0036ABCBBE